MDEPIVVNFSSKKGRSRRTKKAKAKPQDLYVERGYDETTTVYYKTMRKRGLDPFTQDKPIAPFLFHDMWDPYTGERVGVDPNGPLHLDPDQIIKYVATSQPPIFWIKSMDTNQGYFEGCPVNYGGGYDFNIVSRGGEHLEYNKFRVPIPDLYLPKGHSRQLPTLCPEFTQKEIEEIDRLAELQGDNYLEMFGVKRPSLVYIKKLTDRAVDPDLSDEENIKAVKALQKVRS